MKIMFSILNSIIFTKHLINVYYKIYVIENKDCDK